MIPRPSHEVTGVFLDDWVKKALSSVGQGGMAILLPYNTETGLFRVGMAASIEDLWKRKVIVSPSLEVREAVFARVDGKMTAKADGFEIDEGALFATGVEPIDLHKMRSTYPVIDGAGWTASEGATEARSPEDIRVEIYGATYEGEPVVLGGNLGGLVSPETAHTVEHALIRSLSTFAIATPKTLRNCLAAEARDLKDSLDIGYKLRMPEFFGVTPTGMCGNPLTGLAHFYLAGELQRNLRRGDSMPESLENARLSALSKVADDLELSTESGSRILQGLRRGMKHDDSSVESTLLRKVLSRFPLSPFT
jgi:hypothetical protein